ncbi:MAG TPA: SRPBCC family protein [Blastocatellia bacterium]|nr:SRPBCC family protein [Blastocatellia bacterium]
MKRVEKWVEIKAPVGYVFRLFSSPGSFPRWMQGVEAVRSLRPGWSHWTARDPSGATLEWEAEATHFDPDRRLAWRSPRGPVEAEWDASFEETKRGTTLMCLRLSYDEADTGQTAAAAWLLGEDPRSRLGENLARFKQLAELESPSAALPGVGPQTGGPGPVAPSDSGLAPAASMRRVETAGPHAGQPAGRGLQPNRSGTSPPARAGYPVRPQQIALAGLLVLVLGGIWYLVSRPRSAAPISGAATPAPATTPAPPPEATPEPALAPADLTATKAQRVTPETTAEPSPPPAEQAASARRESIRAAIDQWVAATNAQDVDKLMGMYAPLVQRYYRMAYVSRDVVRADKRRALGEAEAVRVSVDEPHFTFRMEGNVAYVRFRKQYEIERRGRTRRGEVWHELALSRQGEGWQIFSERDLRVIW